MTSFWWWNNGFGCLHLTSYLLIYVQLHPVLYTLCIQLWLSPSRVHLYTGNILKMQGSQSSCVVLCAFVTEGKTQRNSLFSPSWNYLNPAKFTWDLVNGEREISRIFIQYASIGNITILWVGLCSLWVFKLGIGEMIWE